jgi:HNH endonuclease
MPRGRQTLDMEERFWSKVKRVENSCWNWVGYVEPNGYGRFSTCLKGNINAHIMAYYYANPKENMKDLCVLHHCDNRKCCNPNHLFLETYADNGKDMALKFRAVSKLTPQQVIEIRQKLKAGNYTQAQIGVEYGVRQSHISRIKSGEYWSHTCS